MSSNDKDNKLKIIATLASVSTSVLLVIIKAIAAFFTGSLSVLSSMTDSLADVVSSLISFVAVRYAVKPLSADHRYGYGRAESVSALLQAAFIVGSAGFILYDVRPVPACRLPGGSGRGRAMRFRQRNS